MIGIVLVKKLIDRVNTGLCLGVIQLGITVRTLGMIVTASTGVLVIPTLAVFFGLFFFEIAFVLDIINDEDHGYADFNSALGIRYYFN